MTEKTSREYIISIRQMSGRSIEKISYMRLIMPAYHDKGWYVQGLSFSAFFHSYKPRNIRNRDRNIWYTQKTREAFEADENHMYESLKKYGKNFERVDINHLPLVKGIWDFYDHINFDHKKKRYKHDVDGMQMRETRRKEAIEYRRILKLYDKVSKDES